METLDVIQTALSGIYDEVHYGAAVRHPQGKPWNYTVYWRESTTAAPHLTGATDRYKVAVVREGSVPEDALGELVGAMEAIPGVKMDSTVDYTYDVKPGSSDVVEMMTVSFTKARKRG